MLESCPCLTIRRALKNFADFSWPRKRERACTSWQSLMLPSFRQLWKKYYNFLGTWVIFAIFCMSSTLRALLIFFFLWLSFLLSFYFQLFINISSLTSSKCTELTIVQGWLFLIPILFNQFLSIFYGSLPLLKWPSV